MAIFSEEIKKTTGLLYCDDKFVGSGVVFLHNDKIYFVTAGHNIYGKAFDKTPEISKLKVEFCENQFLNVLNLFGDVSFASTNDIIVLQLEASANLETASLLTPVFSTIPKNPMHNLLLRGKYANSKDIINKRKISYDQLHDVNKNQFVVNIPKEQLVNSSFSSGSEWLNGMSGSGLFYENHNSIILTGVLIEILNKGNDGKMLIASVCVLNELIADLEIVNSNQIDLESVFNAESLNSIIDDNDDEVIADWERKASNNPQLDYINRKLREIYPETELLDQKRKLIRKLLIGNTFIETELKKHEQLKQSYDLAYKVHDLEDKKDYVNSKKEAKDLLNKIMSDYESYLTKELSGKIESSVIKLLTSYGVANWIANCSIDFLKDE
jgi:hypothetical protein